MSSLREWVRKYLSDLPSGQREQEEQRKAEKEARAGNLKSKWEDLSRRATAVFQQFVDELGIGRVKGNALVQLELSENYSIVVKQPFALDLAAPVTAGGEEKTEATVLLNFPAGEEGGGPDQIKRTVAVEELDDEQLECLVQEFLKDPRCERLIGDLRSVRH